MKRLLIVLLSMLLLIPWAQAENSGMVADILFGADSEWSECSLGDATADAIAAGTGVEVAVLPALAIRGNLRGGQVTEEEVLRAVDGEMTLAVAEVDKATLKRLLEDGLSKLTVDVETERLDKAASSSPKFPQISGFALEVNASALVGDRVWRITMPEQYGDLITLCSSRQWLEELGIPCKAVEGTPADYLIDYIAWGGLTDGVETGRIRILGTLDDNFMEGIPPLAVLLVLGVVLVFAVGYVRTNGRPKSKRYGTR